MTRQHRLRTVSGWAAVWTWTKRGFSLLVVIVIGLAVYLGARRAEAADARAAHQDCLNQAYSRSLNDRAVATDDLVNAILAVNQKLADDAGNTKAQTLDRRDFAAEVAKVQRTRDQAKDETATDQGASCG